MWRGPGVLSGSPLVRAAEIPSRTDHVKRNFFQEEQIRPRPCNDVGRTSARSTLDQHVRSHKFRWRAASFA
jgi:hypothetical protein